MEVDLRVETETKAKEGTWLSGRWVQDGYCVVGAVAVSG